ncbi:Cyclic AMP-responsive element-binding protein 3-like protein 3 [Porphyridium purpureum]|uniref:Cyclic AMP-responsive element-binding protein 3-like protein 3 n=1 Tax=Porphyridium purpureum TaxID=35688 RepID=A0A5J4Z728_PORPP|nr:Cyclic AMP-responsive element-binding protein 3-like protein 3 [Porphyridium purpureum]|eukprot:POR8661..scf295_1
MDGILNTSDTEVGASLPTLASLEVLDLFPAHGVDTQAGIPAECDEDCGANVSRAFPEQEMSSRSGSKVTSPNCSQGSAVSAESGDWSTHTDNLQVSINGKRVKVDPKVLEDLSGCTASVARRMSPEDRAIMLMKRKLRNRESAKRSRVKRLQTIDVLEEQLHVMSRATEELRRKCDLVVRQNMELVQQNQSLGEALAVAHGSQPLAM